MDYDNPQFITAVKKILRDGIAHLTESLNDLKESVSEHWQSDEKRYQTKPITVTDFRANVPIPVENKTKKSVPEWIWTIFKGALEILGIAAVIGYTYISFHQWRDSHRYFIIDEQAWISVNHSWPDKNRIQENAQIGVDLRLRNTGKTFAKMVNYNFDIAIPRNGEEVHPDWSGYHLKGVAGLIAPNEISPPFSVIRSEGEQERPNLLTKNEADDLINGRRYIAVFGEGTFVDVFGERHWFRFCNYKGGLGATIFRCVTYNNVGDGMPPEDK